MAQQVDRLGAFLKRNMAFRGSVYIVHTCFVLNAFIFKVVRSPKSGIIHQIMIKPNNYVGVNVDLCLCYKEE